MSDMVSGFSRENPQDNIVSELRLLLSKNKQLVELMHRKFALDLERENIFKQKDERYSEVITRFEKMKDEMDVYDKKFSNVIHVLKILTDTIKNEVKIDRNEMDEKISDIFKQL
ncbi:hypothetical protein GQ472_00810 [archaeon]|nr:hypothetical protein [archaeon]